MSTSPHLQRLVAHYLASNYPAVLETFLTAAQIPAPDLTSPPRPDLQTLIADYESYQLSQHLEATSIDEETQPAQDGTWRGWKLGDMLKVGMSKEVRLSGVKRTYEDISAANLLTVGVQAVPWRSFNTSNAA